MRQHVMSRCAGTWDKFTEMYNSTPPGNNGNIGLYSTLTYWSVYDTISKTVNI